MNFVLPPATASCGRLHDGRQAGQGSFRRIYRSSPHNIAWSAETPKNCLQGLCHGSSSQQAAEALLRHGRHLQGDFSRLESVPLFPLLW